VFDHAPLTGDAILNACDKLMSGSQLKVLFVDPIELMEPSSEQNELEQLRTLKFIAKKLCITVVAAARVPRHVEERANMRPKLRDLNSDFADVIAFLFREEYYEPDTDLRGVAELIIARHRLGPTGTIELIREGSTGRFRNRVTGY